jgi:predicted acylesterase/phospholipase RssA
MLASLLLSAAGCSSLQRNPVPVDQIHEAELAGMPGIRAFWNEIEADRQFQQDIIRSIQDELHDLFLPQENGVPSYSGLAISGGGPNGAFGAGVLCGWSEAGTRPQFKLVTGISAGALIAPYAFLGPAYDEELKAAYTKVSTKDIARISRRAPWRSESLLDSSPLADLIAKDLNAAMLADIAAAHARGQRLYIGTTNLDAERLVVWNMGAIAASGHPGALGLFRKVMLASASIPGAFPPVYIEVDVNGQTYDEMHVDGGVITQVFFYEFMLNIRKAAEDTGTGAASQSSGQAYVILNGKTNPEPKQLPRQLLAISERALYSMIKSASINDLFRIYQFAHRDNIDFSYADIPEDFQFESEEIFDPKEMNALFDLGYRMAREGSVWQKTPFEYQQSQ